MKRLAALPLAISLCCATLAQAAAFEPFTVSDIRVDGLQRISAGTVFTYLPVERGDRMDSLAAQRAVRALFRTGFFNDISLDRQGDILVITVVERPAISKVTLIGNKDIKTDELQKNLKAIGIAEGETFDRLQLDRVVQELTRAYNNRGKYNVSIQPSVTPQDRNRVDVQIDVKEGKAAKIRSVNIVGNEAFSDKELRKGWESNSTNWKSWYKRDDQYSREKLSGDLEKLSSYYLDRGYVDFETQSTQVSITPDRRNVYLTANIEEGEIYTVSEAIVTGDTVIPQEEMERLVIVRPGQTYSRRLLELTSDGMAAMLGNIGYAFAQVTPIPDVDKENRTVKINFFVEPGKRVQVRRVLFKGNTRTGDAVLRREMRQFEGSWYSQAAVDRSKVRLKRLGYFREVDVENQPVPGTDDQVDVVFRVEETTSGSFMFGIGYSQLAGLITSVSVTQDNFLGTGNRIGVAIQDNDYARRYDLNYFDPYFTRDGISAGYSLSYRELDQSDFNIASYYSDSGMARVTFGIPLTENDTVGLSFGVDSNMIRTYQGTPQPIIDYIDAIGRRTFHTWRSELSWARDSRNAYWNPTRGSYQRVAAEIALPGSTAEYYKLYYQYAKYWPVTRSLVLLTNVELGYGDSYGNRLERTIYNEDGTVAREVVADGLPFFENFYAGGVRSIRGFEDNTLGPTYYSEIYGYRQALGGALKTTGSIEAIFPTLFDTDQTRLSAFIDFGNVYRDASDFEFREYRASIGVSLQWQAPVGPIVLNLSYPFLTDDNDRTERLQFSFGQQF